MQIRRMWIQIEFKEFLNKSPGAVEEGCFIQQKSVEFPVTTPFSTLKSVTKKWSHFSVSPIKQFSIFGTTEKEGKK